MTSVPTPSDVPRGLFERILVAVDGSEGSRLATVQAERLVEPDGLVSTVTATRLAGELARFEPSLVVLPARYAALARTADCSVLIARPTLTEAPFPASLAVGVDGSPASLAALGVARAIGSRFSIPVHALLARGGDVDVVHAELEAPDLEIVDGLPVDALVEAAEAADLVVVGGRGLHGDHATGSACERVARQAASSVLIVRPRRQPRRRAPRVSRPRSAGAVTYA